MVIDENKRRHEREEFMRPRYARVKMCALAVRMLEGYRLI